MLSIRKIMGEVKQNRLKMKKYRSDISSRVGTPDFIFVTICFRQEIISMPDFQRI